MKRKLLAILLATLFLFTSSFSLVGCSQSNSNNSSGGGTSIEGDVNDNSGGGSNDNSGGSSNDNSGGGSNDNSGGSSNDNSGGSSNDNSGGGSNDNSGGGSNDNSGGGSNDNSGGGVNIDFDKLTTKVFNAFGNTPDPWSFFPDAFDVSARSVTNEPSYTNFYSVTNLPTNGIGKQLSVAYDLINVSETALSFVRPVYSVMNTIKSLYTAFVDKNPEEYKSFSGTAAGITFTLTLTETTYSISASVKETELSIFADTEESFGAKVKLSKNTILKYLVSNDKLIIALDIADVSATQIEFVRNGDVVLGYMYEYIVAGDKTLTSTSSLIRIDQNYTTLIGTKGDFIPTSVSRNCEVYSSKTGKLIGTEVREEMTIGKATATYNTLWYPLNTVVGINNIKKVDQMNGTNADTIYINNGENPIKSSHIILPLNKAGSRKFDIEFKKMYFYKYDQKTEKYQEISCEIPMIFIQAEQLDDFVLEFSKANKDYLSGNVSLNVSASDKAAVNYGYTTLLDLYDTIKDSVSFTDITNFCKN